MNHHTLPYDNSQCKTELALRQGATGRAGDLTYPRTGTTESNFITCKHSKAVALFSGGGCNGPDAALSYIST